MEVLKKTWTRIQISPHLQNLLTRLNRNCNKIEADQVQGGYLMLVQLKMKQLHASQTQMDKKKKSNPDTFCLMVLQTGTDSAQL
jgi:hypothetical protein